MLPPSLFSLYLKAVLETMNEGLNRDVFIRTGTDGKLFNLAQLDICSFFLLELFPIPPSGLICRPLANWPSVGKIKLPNRDISFSVPTFFALDLSMRSFMRVAFFIDCKNQKN